MRANPHDDVHDEIPPVLPLHAPQAQAVELSGGKGASLARAARVLPVPAAVIVTSRGYRDFVRPLQPAIDALLRRHAGDHAAISSAVRARLAGEPLPAWLPGELAQALRDESLLGAALAVRSSATQEDSSAAAFAGQHDTVLNQRELPGIVDAVRRCYLSMWNEWALSYRERMGLGHLDAAMAVVVQRMVDVRVDDAAGVAFSIDPVRGRLDCVLINAAFGLGESVVGGECAVDEFRVARDADASAQLPVLEQRIADKHDALVAHELREGTQRAALDEALRLRPALDAGACREVARLALAAEQHFGFPQDIEWAYEHGRLQLLQSRPVTRIPARWTRDESAERFPNPVTPMTWHLVEQGFHASLNHSFSLMGLPPFRERWFALHDGYVYGNQNAVELYSGRLPTGMLRDRDTLTQALPELARRYAWVQELPLRWMRDLDTYLLGIGALMAEPLQGRCVAELWRYVLEVRDLGRAYFLPNIAISLTQRSLYLLLHRLVDMLGGVSGDEARARVDALLACTDTKTGHIHRELHELARLVRGLPEGLRWLASEGDESARDAAERLHRHPVFEARFGAFLRCHGHREIDFDAYHPTWVDRPDVVLEHVRLLATEPEADVWSREQALKRAALEIELELLDRTPPELRYLVHEVLRLARVYTALDDLEHYQTTRLTLPLRRGLAAIGARLLERGVLEHPDDVYFCPPATFSQAVASGDFAPVRDAVRGHKAQYAVACARTPQWELGVGNVIDRDARVLHGLGGSRGVAVGVVHAVRGPQDFAHFPAGAMLLARTTSPAWTPLFYRAAGVITESGGPLSHGAVTARELGLPAVMGVRHALELLADGTRVRIDGGQGLVQLLGA